MAKESVDYTRAAKTTFLFSFVQIVSIAVAIIRNKIIAVILGPTGVGLISIFTTYTNFVKTGACLGLSQSAVRDISEAYEANDYSRFSRTISLTNKLVVCTSLLGVLVTVLMSPFFSKWGFGNEEYVWSFILLALCVGFQIYTENLMAILKGMREMKSLAWATIIGSVAGLIISIPFYFLLGNDGIVPTLLLSAFVAVVATNYFVRRIRYDRIEFKIKELFSEGKPMIQMGCALMMINFLSGIFDTIIISYLRGAGGLDVVAFFGAGRTIIGSYFGVVMVAMSTDYYPRICGVYKDNKRLKEEVDAQSKLGMILSLPLALIFIAFASLFIPILYSGDFECVSLYTDWALLGTLISVPSNCIGMVLLAKQAAKLFTTISVSINIFNLLLYIAAYHLGGLTGLGVAATINVAMQWIVQSVVIRWKYNIFFSKEVNVMLVTILMFSLASILLKSLENVVILYCAQTLLICMSFAYSYIWMKKMNMNLSDVVRKFNRRKR